MVLTQILKRNAKDFPNVPAMTMKMGFRTISMTYKDVYDLSRCVALLLEKNGVNKGDKVILLAPNSPYWVCCFWGCMLRGAIAVPLNVQSTPEMIDKIIEQTGAKLFFAHRFYKHKCNLPRYDVDLIRDSLKEFNPKSFRKIDLSEDDLVEILYTSGTTGDPKGVMLSHKNLYSNIAAASKMVVLKMCKERVLSILPLSHIFEQAGGLLLPYHYVAHIIYAHSYAAIGELMKEYKITKMMAVPEFLKIMMTKIEGKAGRFVMRFLPRIVRRKLGGIDTIVCGGAPLDSVLEKKWNSLGIYLFQGYGLTETSPLVSSNTYDYHRFASVGKIAHGVKVKLGDDGEVLVKGPNVFSGYFKDETRTSEAFTEDGFFKTGDIGEFDKDGYLFLKGRKKYMILGPGGQNVFPEDIEDVLNKFPGIKDSTVVGVEVGGGMVEINAVLLTSLDAKELEKIVSQANEKLASYQQISNFTVWPEEDFPRSATRKVKKNEILSFLARQKISIQAPSTKTTPLISLLSKITGVDKEIINGSKTLGELHLDSLMRVELIAQVEERFFVFLDETKLVSKLTVDELEKMIEKNEPAKSLPPLRKWPRALWARFLRFILQPILFLFMRIFVKLEISGGKNIKNISTPVVFMPNHISYVDPAILVAALPRAIGRRVAFAAANDVLYEEFKWFVWPSELFFNSFPFPRKEGENIRLGLDYMGKMLDDRYSIALFPEGMVSKSGELLPLKRGAGLVAVEMDVTVVPVLIEGSAKIFPFEKIFPRARGKVKISFGKPMTFKCTDSYIEATEIIERAIKDLAQ